MSIAAINPTSIPHIPLPSTTPSPSSSDFSAILKSTMREVEQSNQTANAAIGRFLSGEEGELHNTVLATQKADLQFEMFMQVRNKVVGAYQEIMRMQI